MNDQLNTTSQIEPQEKLVTADDLLEPIAKFNQFRKYWKTREAVLGGVAVYDMPKAAREKEGYLGAWAFNVAQSSFSAFPAAVAGIVTWFFRIKLPSDGSDNSITEALVSCSIPFMMMMIAYSVGRASLWKRDSTKISRNRAARIYLYLDGAHGLYPQLIWSVMTIPLLGLTTPPTQVIGMWQFVISMKTIPNDLFPALGYWGGRNNFLLQGTNIPSILTAKGLDENAKNISQPEPPVWKYRMSVLLIAPLIAIGTVIVVAVLGILVSAALDHIRPPA